MSIQLLQTVKSTIALQASSIANLNNLLNEDFVSIVELIAKNSGRLVVSGVGKSAIIAQKIVATLNSTGTPSLFMHAADAIHGDLGMIQKDDIVMLISKSGESPEIKLIIPLIKNFGNRLIGMGGNTESYLYTMSDYYINTTVSHEACPNNLAPTTSTTAQMVMGDALAICLMELRGFTGNDFAKYHPGGNLGKRLYLKVRDLYTINSKPTVSPNAELKEIIVEITQNRLGATAVTEAGKLIGIITDGDVRRMLENPEKLNTIVAKELMHLHPKSILPEELAVNALEILRNNDISQLCVTDEFNNYLGMLHLHDIVKEGIV